MNIAGWDQRYSAGDADTSPSPILIRATEHLPTGTALDLACGAGRNALYLARRGWQVTAVDGSPNAIETVRARAASEHLKLTTVVADLEAHAFTPGLHAFDLVAILYYLQRDLFPTAKQAVKPGGLLVAISHTVHPGEEPTAHRLMPGELRTYFNDWDLLEYSEGPPEDPAHRRAVAQLVARKPL